VALDLSRIYHPTQRYSSFIPTLHVLALRKLSPTLHPIALNSILNMMQLLPTPPEIPGGDQSHVSPRIQGAESDRRDPTQASILGVHLRRKDQIKKKRSLRTNEENIRGNANAEGWCAHLASLPWWMTFQGGHEVISTPRSMILAVKGW
jgi:hypothetical protein